MLIHIGSDVVIPAETIIAILNLNSMESSDINREFLIAAHEEGFIQDVFGSESPKSVILAENDGKTMIYLSPISSITLAKRVNLKYDPFIKFLESKEVNM